MKKTLMLIVFLVFAVNTSGAETIKINDSVRGLKVGFLGDSIVEKNGTATKNFVANCTDDLGIVSFNYGKSGSGFMRRYEESKAYFQRVAKIDPELDMLIIYGSGNDTKYADVLGKATDLFEQDNMTVAGCINKTIDTALSINPDMQIKIITPVPWKAFRLSKDNNSMALYVDMLIDICTLRGIPYLDLYHESGLKPWDDGERNAFFDADGIHPNDAGHEVITPLIVRFLST